MRPLLLLELRLYAHFGAIGACSGLLETKQ